MADHLDYDVLVVYSRQIANKIDNQIFLVLFAKRAIGSASLTIVIRIGYLILLVRSAHRSLCYIEFCIVHERCLCSIRLVVEFTMRLTAIHLTILVVAVDVRDWLVDLKLLEVWSHSMALRIEVGKEPAL
jgi:hypothetical protein